MTAARPRQRRIICRNPPPPACDCSPYISAPHWEPLPKTLPRAPIPLSIKPAGPPARTRQKPAATKRPGTGMPSHRNVHPAIVPPYGASATIANLCAEDRRRLATLVQQLAIAEAQKQELEAAASRAKKEREEIAQELRRTKKEKGEVVERNEAIKRRLQKAEELLRQYEVQIDNTKAEVHRLQVGKDKLSPTTGDATGSVRSVELQALAGLQAEVAKLTQILAGQHQQETAFSGKPEIDTSSPPTSESCTDNSPSISSSGTSSGSNFTDSSTNDDRQKNQRYMRPLHRVLIPPRSGNTQPLGDKGKDAARTKLNDPKTLRAEEQRASQENDETPSSHPSSHVLSYSELTHPPHERSKEIRDQATIAGSSFLASSVELDASGVDMKALLRGVLGRKSNRKGECRKEQVRVMRDSVTSDESAARKQAQTERLLAVVRYVDSGFDEEEVRRSEEKLGHKLACGCSSLKDAAKASPPKCDEDVQTHCKESRSTQTVYEVGTQTSFDESFHPSARPSSVALSNTCPATYESTFEESYRACQTSLSTPRVPAFTTTQTQTQTDAEMDRLSPPAPQLQASPASTEEPVPLIPPIPHQQSPPIQTQSQSTPDTSTSRSISGPACPYCVLTLSHPTCPLCCAQCTAATAAIAATNASATAINVGQQKTRASIPIPTTATATAAPIPPPQQQQPIASHFPTNPAFTKAYLPPDGSLLFANDTSMLKSLAEVVREIEEEGEEVEKHGMESNDEDREISFDDEDLLDVISSLNSF